MNLGGVISMSKNQTWNRNYVTRGQKSVYLDGGDDYITVGDHDDFSFTTGTNNANDGSLAADMPFTISMWFKADNPQTQIGLISKSHIGSGGHEYRMFMVNGKIYFDINTNSSGVYKRCYTGTITYANTWTHVVFTYNGDSTTAGTPTKIAGKSIYVNGQIQTITSASGGSYSGMNNETSELIFGWLMSDQAYDLKGWIADIILWKNFELNSDQIRGFYAEQPGTVNYSVNPMIAGLGGIYPVEAAEACKLWLPCDTTTEVVAPIDYVPPTPGYEYLCAREDREPPSAPGACCPGGDPGTVTIIAPEDEGYEEYCMCDEGYVCYAVYYPDLEGTYQAAVDGIYSTDDLEVTPNQHNATLKNNASMSTVAAANSPTQLTLPNHI